jgi:NitT/TauT family transport system substrate-binding protein
VTSRCRGKTPRIRWWAGTLLALAFVLGSLPARAGGELVIAVARLPVSLPVYVAQARGFFAAEKLPLKVLECDIGRHCLEHMLEGRAHFATAAVSPLVFASLRGARFAVIATMATALNDTKIITRSDSGIAVAANLDGRRVGTLVATSAQYFLDLSLLAAGVDPARVTVVPLEPADAAAALQTGRVDAVSIFEPYAFQTVRLLGPRARVLSDRHRDVETWNVVVSQGLVRDHEDELERLCRALERAERFIAEEPAAARAILRERLRLDEAALDWIWNDLEFRLELRQSLLTSLEGQARWALRNGRAQGPAPNYLDYIRTGPLGRVRPGAVGIVQ